MLFRGGFNCQEEAADVILLDSRLERIESRHSLIKKKNSKKNCYLAFLLCAVQ